MGIDGRGSNWLGGDYLGSRGSFGGLGVAGLEMEGVGRGTSAVFVLEPKESTKEGKNKSAIAIGSKSRSGKWKNGRLVGYPLC